MVFAIDSMSPQMEAAAPDWARRSRARIKDNRVGLRGQRNPLKRLDPAKYGIIAPRESKSFPWAALVPALPGFA